MITVQEIRELSNERVDELFADARLYFQNESNVANGLPENDEKIIARYSEDLNAIHQAEEVLGLGWQEDYQKMMVKMQNNGRGWLWDITHATSRQKSEAFIMLREFQGVCKPCKKFPEGCNGCDKFAILGCEPTKGDWYA